MKKIILLMLISIGSFAQPVGTKLKQIEQSGSAGSVLTTTGTAGVLTYTNILPVGVIPNLPAYTPTISGGYQPKLNGTGFVTVTGTVVTYDNTAYLAVSSAAGLYTPLTRSLTINGINYDLSANRTWTVGDLFSTSTYSNPSWIATLNYSKVIRASTTNSPSINMPVGVKPTNPVSGDVYSYGIRGWVFQNDNSHFAMTWENGTSYANAYIDTTTNNRAFQLNSSNIPIVIVGGPAAGGSGVTTATNGGVTIGVRNDNPNAKLLVTAGSTLMPSIAMQTQSTVATPTLGNIWFNSAAGGGGFNFYGGVTTPSLMTANTLSVTSTSTLSGAVVAASSLSVGTTATLTGAVRATNNLSVTGTFSAGSTSTMNGITNTGGITTSTTFSAGTTATVGTAINTPQVTNAGALVLNAATGNVVAIKVNSVTVISVSGGTSGAASITHVAGLTSVGTATLGTGAGTGATSTLTACTDVAGTVSVTTAGSPATSAAVITIPFGAAFTTAPHVILTPKNAATAALTGATSVYPTTSTTQLIINSNTSALTTGTVYVWDYMLVQ